METGQRLDLADWRRLTTEMYAEIRRLSGADPQEAWMQFRDARDEQFRSHTQSPLDATEKARFIGLRYFSHNPAWRVAGTVRMIDPSVRPSSSTPVTVDLPEGKLSYHPIATVAFEPPATRGERGALTLYWIDGYGGGLFLPFKDLTNRRETYGGGRYLYDSIKGADLGSQSDRMVLDFNFAYNPSCAYSPRWVCPLAPRENALPFRVEAGELTPRE